jgi:hypothetical protein
MSSRVVILENISYDENGGGMGIPSFSQKKKS